jgi:hypothetical protein
MKAKAALVAISLVAAILTQTPRFLVFGEDNFSLIGAYKVFTYGFPFHIVDCTAQLPIHTPEWQVPFLLLTNFIVFLLAGLAIAWLMNRIQRRLKCYARAKR